MNVRPVYKPGEFAKLINVTVKTLQRWDQNGTLPAKRNEAGRRYYTYEQYLKFTQAPQTSDGESTACAIYVGTIPGETWQSSFQKSQQALAFCKGHDISNPVPYAESNYTKNADFKHDALLELTMAIMRDEINCVVAIGLKDVNPELQTIFRYMAEAKHVTIQDLDIETESTESEDSTNV